MLAELRQAALQELLFSLAVFARQHRLSFVFYRLPRYAYNSFTQKLEDGYLESSGKLMLQFSTSDIHQSSIQDWRMHGHDTKVFVFSPFTGYKVKEELAQFKFYYLELDMSFDDAGMLLWRKKKDIVWLAEQLANLLGNFAKRREQAGQAGQAYKQFQENPSMHVPYYVSHQPMQETSLPMFHASVNKALERIDSGYLQKVVVSRVKNFGFPGFSNTAGHVLLGDKEGSSKKKKREEKLIKHSLAKDIFFALAKAFITEKESMVCFFSSPKAKTWFTVSPELLMSQSGPLLKGRFVAVSLAGTQRVKEKLLPKHVAWQDKEIVEQAIVSRFVVDCFKMIRLRAYSENGPYTVRCNNVYHLKSEFTVNIKKDYGPLLILDMLGMLHPSSSVAGFPREKALHVIHSLEAHERAFYTGYFGPLQLKKESALYVNLRCAEVLADHLRLYAGTGIVKGSDAQSEWHESEAKLQSLLSFFEDA